MQLGQAQVVRSDWYDRALTNIGDMYHNAVGNHGNTLRLTFTVPVNRVLKLAGVYLIVERLTVAAPVNSVQCEYRITPSLEAVDRLVNLTMYDNAVGAHRQFIGGHGMLLLAGDVLSIYTSDASTGGLVQYSVSYEGVLYDA